MRPTVQHIETPAGRSFLLERYRPRDGWAFNWHGHPEFELTLIERGRGRRLVGDHAGDFADGDLVLIGPDLPHTWQSVPRGRAAAVVAQFAADWPARAGLGLPEHVATRRMLARASVALRFTGKAAANAADDFAAAVDLAPARQARALVDVLCRLAAVRGPQPLATPAFAARAVRQGRRSDALIDRAAAHVAACLDAGRCPTQAGVAARCRASPSSFSRAFRRTTGRTFTAFLHEARVARACRLLIETDAKTTAVALDSGFENLSNFNRIFKRLAGTTPSAYRAARRG